jgi:UDP-N-acetylglucosamine 2-epimerase (non-hydrolysing)
MIDTLLMNRDKARKSDILRHLSLAAKDYIAITLHRPNNVDNPETLDRIITSFEIIAKETKIVFPVHPRTRRNLKETDLGHRLETMENLLLVEPLGYLDFLCLISNAAVVMTDSGGIQEETTMLGVPCMTLRESTERPVTISEGTNRLVHATTEDILKNFRQILHSDRDNTNRIPRFWDGKAAERIAQILENSCK